MKIGPLRINDLEKLKSILDPQTISYQVSLAIGSPHLPRHHANWRLTAMDRHLSMDKNTDLAYSAPMSIGFNFDRLDLGLLKKCRM